VRIVLAIVNAVVLLAGVGLLALRSGDRAVAFTPDRAVVSFRTPVQQAGAAPSPAEVATTVAAASSAAADAPAAGTPTTTPTTVATPTNAATVQAPATGPLTRPAAGVYVYKTDGQESVDVLGGATHDYPDETTIIVRHTDCGFDTEWRPLEQRAEYRAFCLGERGLRIAVLAGQREFFGRSAGYYQQCVNDTYYLPLADGGPPATWTETCQNDQGNQVTLNGKALGRQPRPVGAETVDAIQFEITTHRVTDQRETSVRSVVTMAAATGLVLALESTTRAVVNSPTGSGTYDERYTLELTDLTPRT
jgi:hypothetical protein